MELTDLKFYVILLNLMHFCAILRAYYGENTEKILGFKRTLQAIASEAAQMFVRR